MHVLIARRSWMRIQGKVPGCAALVCLRGRGRSGTLVVAPLIGPCMAEVWAQPLMGVLMPMLSKLTEARCMALVYQATVGTVAAPTA